MIKYLFAQMPANKLAAPVQTSLYLLSKVIPAIRHKPKKHFNVLHFILRFFEQRARRVERNGFA